MSRRLISSGSTFEAAIGYSRAVVDGDWVYEFQALSDQQCQRELEAEFGGQCTEPAPPRDANLQLLLVSRLASGAAVLTTIAKHAGPLHLQNCAGRSGNGPCLHNPLTLCACAWRVCVRAAGV